MDCTRIRQYGLQRTGTNAVRALLEINCGVNVLTHTNGSKHDLPTREAVEESDTLFVINVKDPISWLASYYRYRSLQAREAQPQRRMDPIGVMSSVWLPLWQDRTTAYLELAEKYPSRTAVIQHEALLR